MSEPSPGDDAESSRRSWLDWRIWIGLVIAGVSIWWAMRGVPYADVWAAMGDADVLLLLALSLPAHVASVYVRALRCGGGSGGSNTQSQSARAGGAGADGVIIVWEYF